MILVRLGGSSSGDLCFHFEKDMKNGREDSKRSMSLLLPLVSALLPP
ncbi:hypothetical protein COLO4_04353 [Corchorus olitorius]|uniref:Uncharacterized protein n=1 Tax=Corchorus olitorius TaxID=93759 RepID=A0A1R3KUA9_9ROSI|nr:hypothetical protein COLO4_04353 [Corchorus olitorius]